MKKGKMVISFVPVLHRGYLDFLEKADAEMVCLVEASDVPELPHLAREVRALRFQEVQKMLTVLNFIVIRFAEVKETIRESRFMFCMPDEDVSRILCKKYFQGIEVELVPTFLRWDWGRSVGAAHAVLPRADRTIRKGDSKAGKVSHQMNILFKEKEKSSDWWRQVAAMVVCKDGKTIVAHNQHFPNEYVPYLDGDPRNNFGPGEFVEVYTSLHAERGAIAYAAKQGIALDGADMYVTTFPCSECANQLVVSGIKRIFFAGGYSNLNGEKTLRDHGVEMIYVEM